MIRRYICEKCGKQFTTDSECYLHELNCIHNITGEKAKLLLEDFCDPNSWNETVCKNCKNSYLVYGCELNCKYSQACRYDNKYKYWESKNA